MSRQRGSKNRPKAADVQQPGAEKPYTPARAVLVKGVWVRQPADCLTGKPADLSQDMPTILVRHWDDTRNDDVPLVRSEYVPTKPTVQRIDRGDGRPDVRLNQRGEEVLCSDREGGKAWSHEMEEFMRGVLPNDVAAERKNRLAWYNNNYVLGRMYARLGTPTVLALLRIQRGGEDLNDVARDIGRSRVWILQQFRLLARMVAEYYPDPRQRARHGIPNPSSSAPSSAQSAQSAQAASSSSSLEERQP